MSTSNNNFSHAPDEPRGKGKKNQQAVDLSGLPEPLATPANASHHGNSTSQRGGLPPNHSRGGVFVRGGHGGGRGGVQHQNSTNRYGIDRSGRGGGQGGARGGHHPRGNGQRRNPSSTPVDHLSSGMSLLSLSQSQSKIEKKAVKKPKALTAEEEAWRLQVPAIEFHKFLEFPTEMRLKVWNAFAESENPRMLEVTRDLEIAKTSSRCQQHTVYRIAPKSSKAPTVLHVCHESREEALKVFKLCNLTSHDRKGEDVRPIYFNPTKDVFYFGDGTCRGTLVGFVNDRKNDNQDIKKVAILCSGKNLNCCDFAPEDLLNGADSEELAYGLAFHFGCSPMQALHGIDPEIAGSAWPCVLKGLKEVNWIVPSAYMAVPQGEFNRNVGMRPAVGNGVTDRQKVWKNRIEDDIARVQSGLGLQQVGENKWSGGNAPNFRWMSLAPIPEAGKQYDSMWIKVKDVGKLKYKNWAIVRDAERKSKCIIQVCERDHAGSKETEIGFYGSEQGIALAKKNIEEDIAAANSAQRGLAPAVRNK